MPTPTTVTYKQIDTLSLQIDIYLPDAAEQPAPSILYFHGGGLTVGDRTSWVPEWLASRARTAGVALVSADYRLMPPSTGHEILADVLDLFAFLFQHGAEHGVDSTRLAVAGTSAGGVCCFLAAAHVSPKPKAVLSICGLGGDFFTPYFLTPKTKPFTMGREILSIADFSSFIYPASTTLQPLCSSPPTYDPPGSPTPGHPSNPRMQVPRVYFQLGTFLDYYTGLHDPSLSATLRALLPPSDSEVEVAGWAGKHAQLRAALPERARALFPQLLVAPDWPPVFFVHGERDTSVRVQGVELLGGLLRDAGVDAQIRIAPGEEHSFDYPPAAEAEYAALFDEAFEFVRRGLMEA